MKSVEDLDVFKLAHQLALKIYTVSKTFPREETFSLVDQMRRAAGSVGMNLMEGAMRLGSKEYRQFVGIARGSAGEICYQFLLAKDLSASPRTCIRNYAPVTTGSFKCSPACPRPSIVSDKGVHDHEHESRSRYLSDTRTNTLFSPTRARSRLLLLDTNTSFFQPHDHVIFSLPETGQFAKYPRCLGC
jgi:four helix bundle protein